MSIPQIIYDILNWQYFGILAIIWIIIDLIWIGRWRALLARIGKLITKPIIFQEDKEPNDPPLYPRIFLEQLALNSRHKLKAPDGKKDGVTNSSDVLQEFAYSLKIKIFNKDKPIRSVGFVICGAFFFFFLLADAIVIAQTMQLLGVIGNLPPIMQKLDIAILGGALFSAVVGVWMLIEMSGDEGELINTDTLTAAQKKIFKGFSIIIIFFAVAVMFALAIQRLIEMGSLESSPTMDIILSFILFGLLAINNSFSAALTFQPMPYGFMVLVFLIIEIIILILPVLAFAADIIWRVVYVFLDFLIWILFTPIIAIPFCIGKVFGWFK